MARLATFHDSPAAASARRQPPARSTSCGSSRRPGLAWLAGFLLLAAFFGLAAIRASSAPSPNNVAAGAGDAYHVAAASSASRFRPIQDVRLGDRTAGRNPHRHEVDLVTPDPAAWHKIALHIKKESGLSLWIELLRPLEWLALHGAEEGATLSLDLPEMGAIGDARVTAIAPCPAIKPGTGAIVTGTFRHEADERTSVVRLLIEGETAPAGVTANHPYWSADRLEFIAACDLHPGETVDTPRGAKRVASITPDPGYRGYLYNLETTEHVYRVGAVGALVHNNCLGNNLIRAGSYGDIGTDAHHIVAYTHRTAKPARDILTKYGIDINAAVNGAWLPRNSVASRARGALHRESGAALTSAYYLNEVNRRLSAADATGGRTHVLRELQKIRYDLLNGSFAGVRPNY